MAIVAIVVRISNSNNHKINVILSPTVEVKELNHICDLFMYDEFLDEITGVVILGKWRVKSEDKRVEFSLESDKEMSYEISQTKAMINFFDNNENVRIKVMEGIRNHYKKEFSDDELKGIESQLELYKIIIHKLNGDKKSLIELSLHSDFDFEHGIKVFIDEENIVEIEY